MSLSAATLTPWIRTLLEASSPSMKLEDYLAGIPRLEALADVPSGTPVLIRGDVDAKPGATIGDGDVRLRSMVETLEYGRKQGWKQIVFGHIGRKPEGSLNKVAKRLGELLKCDVPLIGDWYDEATNTVLPAVKTTIAAAPPGRGHRAGKHAQIFDRVRAVEGHGRRRPEGCRQADGVC